MVHTDAGLWPSAEQSLVLAAALGERHESIAAFATWRDSLDESQTFDTEIAGLLPLLYENLQSWACTDPLMDRLKGAYRMNWVRIQTLFVDLRPVLAQGAAAGSDVVLLRGIPLAAAYYRRPALRPVVDIDFAVPAAQIEGCLALLSGRGWRSDQHADPDVLRLRHALSIHGPGGQEFKLHWRVLPEFADPRADAEFRRHSVPLEFLGQQLRMPDATRMLLQTVIQGVRWNEQRTVRWIADATMILRSRGAHIDWTWLVDFAGRWRLSHRLGLGLGYLTDHFHAAVPPPVLESLGARRPSWVERIESRTLLRDGRQVHAAPLGSLALPFGGYVRHAARANPLKAAWDFLAFLRIHWGLKGRRQIAGRVVRGVHSRLRRVLHPRSGRRG